MRYPFLLIGGFCLALNAFAGSIWPIGVFETDASNRWSILGSLGYGHYPYVYKQDNSLPIGRLALGAELLSTMQTAFGVEVGLQNGARMRFILPQQNPESSFTGMVYTKIRPMVDLLITANTIAINESLLIAQIKGGIIYRQWQIKNNYIGNISELAGELQAGFGYPLTELTNLNLLYQGVFGGNPKFYYTTHNPNGYFATIPTQHGILFGFSVVA